MRKRRTLLVATAGVAVLLPQGAVAAHPPTATAPREISSADPLPTAADPNHCGSAQGVGANDRHNWEQESTMAVNPQDSSAMVVAWMQDWSDAIAVASSVDGGSHWAEVVPPSSICTPGGLSTYDGGAADPGLAWGAPFGTATRGVVYMSCLVASKAVAGATPQLAEVVDTSLDGGRTWNAPAIVDHALAPEYVDGSSLIADPTRPGHAYLTWRRGDTTFATRGVWMSSTADGGAHWSTPLPITTTQFVAGNQLLVLNDGSLLALLSLVPEQPITPGVDDPHGPTTFWAMRSTDTGVTWSQPVQIHEADPDQVDLVGFSAAVGPDGTVHMAWEHAPSATTGPTELRYSRSTDGGTTWLPAPLAVATEPGPPETGAFDFVVASPPVAVSGDGTIGVMFYDHRRDPGNVPPKVTDLWLRSSANGGATWQEMHLAGPFDQTQAPSEDGALPGQGIGFLGDYQGLAPLAHGFDTSFVLAQPLGGADFSLRFPPTDVFFARVSS